MIFARCLPRERPVILPDEAAGRLDAGLQEQLARPFRGLCDTRGTTIISVAHRESFYRYADTR